MLNLPSQPGTAGLVMLVVGAFAGVFVIVVLRGRIAHQLGAPSSEARPLLVTAALALTAAAAPYTLWRVTEDIRETAPITAAHARYVGAETKLVDGELVERIVELIPENATYAVAVAPGAYVEIRESLAQWLGYALLPRRQLRVAAVAEWIVAWGAPPATLGIRAVRPTLVGRNRLSEFEPVYLAEAPS